MHIEVQRAWGYYKGYQAKWCSQYGFNVMGEVCDSPKEAVISLIENFKTKRETIIQELRDTEKFMTDVKRNINQTALQMELMLNDMQKGDRVSIEPYD